MNHTTPQIKKAGKQLKDQRPELKTLINSVIAELQEPEQLNDVLNHGCISGTIPGLIYYRDTCKFYRKNKAAILELVSEYEDSTGEKISELIAKQLNHSTDLKFYSAISRYNEDYAQVYNWLAWFGFEQICYMLSDILESE